MVAHELIFAEILRRTPTDAELLRQGLISFHTTGAIRLVPFRTEDNMVPLPFQRSEYAERLRRVRAEMVKRDLQLLIVNDVANQHYLTGYDGWSFYTPQLVAVPVEDGSEPIWIGRAMDAVGGRLTAWMAAENVIGFPESYVQHADRHPMDWIASHLVERGFGGRRVGIELEAYYFSPKAYSRLVAGMPEATFIDADLLVNWVRSVKSSAEIGYLRKGARLAEGAVRTAYDIIEPGVRECDAIAHIQAAQIAGQADFAG
ncbi:MAG: aminopeptidase P family N-terminal domain-containing protein, partial [Paracoccus sp. (in: a-proteobacteria)]|nr:aminopeptidase P family N-terminal domain-containing protein [Paracoccus sp. (in: a-proteobacteria)]